jgi:hypothetical protein
MKIAVDKLLVLRGQPLEIATQDDGSIALVLTGDGSKVTVTLDPAEATRSGLSLIQCATIGAGIRQGRMEPAIRQSDSPVVR